MKKFCKILPAILLVLIALVGVVSNNMVIPNNIVKAEEVVEYTEDGAFSSKLVIRATSEEKYQADKAQVSAMVETLDIDKEVSKEKNSQIMKDVIDFLKAEGISKNKIEISYYSTYSTKDMVGCGSTGERTCTSFNFEIDDLSKLQYYIDNVCEKGASVTSIRFSLSDYQTKYNDLLTLAIENAKAKAKKLLNKEEINVLKIKEECKYFCNSKYQSYYDGFGADLEIGDITIEAEVEIVAC